VGPRRYRERDRAGRLRYDPARDLAAGSTQGRLAGGHRRPRRRPAERPGRPRAAPGLRPRPAG